MRGLRRAWCALGLGLIALAGACASEEETLPPPTAESIIERDPNTGTVDFYSPGDSTRVLAPGGDAAKAALDWMDAHKDELGIPNPKESYRVVETVSDSEDKTVHVKLEQTAGGLPVWGIQTIVHFDADGAVDALDGPYIPNLDALAKTPPKIDEATARKTAEAHASASRGGALETAIEKEELVVYVDEDYTSAALARHVRLRVGPEHAGFPFEVFVDALDGHIVDAWSASESVLVHATALNGAPLDIHVTDFGTTYSPEFRFQMHRQANQTDALGATAGEVTVVNSATSQIITAPALEGPWDPQGATGMANVRLSERFYVDRYGWQGANGLGSPLWIYTHFANDGWNAFGGGNGDGSGSITFTDRVGDQESAAIALDVVGHELTHVVTSFSSRLVYMRQAGALNEAMSDIFGAAIERSVTGDSPNVFLIAEGSGRAIRNMRHPSEFGDPDRYADRITLPKGQLPTVDNDQGGVHSNSSIVNNAFALMVVGGEHDTTSVRVAKGIGWDSALAFWWKTQRELLTPRSTIFRTARVQSVLALRSRGRFEGRAISCAWRAVGAIGPAFVRDQLRVRCDDPKAKGGTSPMMDSCANKADGVYCSNVAPDRGYFCRAGQIQVTNCEPGAVCVGGSDDGQVVLCRR